MFSTIFELSNLGLIIIWLGFLFAFLVKVFFKKQLLLPITILVSLYLVYMGLWFFLGWSQFNWSLRVVAIFFLVLYPIFVVRLGLKDIVKKSNSVGHLVITMISLAVCFMSSYVAYNYLVVFTGDDGPLVDRAGLVEGQLYPYLDYSKLYLFAVVTGMTLALVVVTGFIKYVRGVNFSNSITISNLAIIIVLFFGFFLLITHILPREWFIYYKEYQKPYYGETYGF
jgi:hypothetical protein